MLQQTTKRSTPGIIAHPRRRDIFFHFIKTGKLIAALSRDRRISVWRKIFFFGSLIALLAILVFPDLLDEAILSIVLPFVGTILGIPLDAGFDWMALALFSVSLLRIFPADIVGEHYQHFFSAP